MGIDGIENLHHGGAHITDVEGFIRKRQRQGKTATEARQALQDNGFDFHAARALIMQYWEIDAPDV